MLKKLLAASVVCLSIAVPAVAAAAPLDGESLAGQWVGSCGRSGASTSPRTTTDGVATGPVSGTYSGGVNAAWDSTTGSVTVLNATFDITDALGNDVPVDVTLGSGHGVGSCNASSLSLTVTDATYTVYDPVTGAVSGTGVVSLSGTIDLGTNIGTFNAVFGPQSPTTTDQCKKDGWKNYPGFKNQGDCVSYVATKGKNKPARS